jgi:hypothetical protein
LHVVHSCNPRWNSWTSVLQFYRKPFSTLVFKIRKNLRKKTLEPILEYHIVEQKNEGRKLDNNSSLRRLKFMPQKLD